MRPIAIAGLVLAALGLFLLVRGVTYKSKESLLEVGEFRAEVQTRKPVPAWIGGVTLAVGVGMVVAGMKRR